MALVLMVAVITSGTVLKGGATNSERRVSGYKRNDSAVCQAQNRLKNYGCVFAYKALIAKA